MTWKISLSPTFLNFKIHGYVYISTIYKHIVSHKRCCGATLRDRRRVTVAEDVSLKSTQSSGIFII